MVASLMLRYCPLPSPCTAVPPRHARTTRSPRIAPLYAQPTNGSNADRGSEASSSGQADQRDFTGFQDDDLGVDASLDLAANSWPRIVLDEPQQTRDSLKREGPRTPADKAKSREAFLLRLATLGFAVRFPTSKHHHSCEACPRSWPQRAPASSTRTGTSGPLKRPGAVMWLCPSPKPVHQPRRISVPSFTGEQAVLLGERLTGRGVVEALGHPTGIPLAEMDVALGLLAGALLVGGLVPTTVIYESVNEEVPGIFDDIPTLIGRASCVLLGLNIISEVITGKGALGLLSVETGTQYISEIEGGLVFLLLIFITNTKNKLL